MPKISSNYGHDKILKDYLGLPKWFLVPTTIQHGWYADIHLGDLVSRNGEKFYLTWSKRVALAATGQTKQRIVVLSAPFILFRKEKKIEISEKAKGTVVFPQHSSKSISIDYDIDKYCKQLKNLPKDYHPITICLHWIDFPKQAAEYENHGFTVVCAGESRQPRYGFVEKFYAILSKHKYSSSNEIGSYAFYAVEMGIPFFIFGERPNFLIKNNQKKLTESSELINQRAKAVRLFSKQTKSISSEQANYVAEELGLTDAVSRKELRQQYIKYGIIYQIFLAPIKPLRAIIRSCKKRCSKQN